MKKLLVVVDMQNDFVTGSLANEEAKKLISSMSEYISSWKDDVVFTRDTHGENYLDTMEGKKLPVKHCIKGSAGWEIVPELKAFSDGKKIFDKPSFGSVELATFIKDEAYEEITFIGVCTGICVISNAVLAKAFSPEAEIKVVDNLCACVTCASHNTALETMKTLQIEVI